MKIGVAYIKVTVGCDGRRLILKTLRASKFCSCANENGSLVVRRATEISLSSLVSDNFYSETILKLKTAR